MSANNLGTVPDAGSSRNPFSYQKVEQVSRDLTSPWLTMEEVTQQLNLFDDESQDTYLTSLELAVRMTIEDLLGMSIFPITYKAYYGQSDTVGTQVFLDLPEVSQDTTDPLTPGTVIESVGYWNGDTPSVFVELDPSSYFYDPTGNKVIVTSGIPSSISQFVTNPIVVRYSTASSPYAEYPVIKQAGLLLLTHLYNNRSNSSTVFLHDIPFGVTALLRPYKPLVM
jgi:hypothetical protein